METKIDTMDLIRKIKTLKNKKNEPFTEQVLIEMLEKYDQYTTFSQFVLTLMKVANTSENDSDMFLAYTIYCELSKSYRVYDFETSQLFYDLYHSKRMEESALGKGSKTERFVFSDADKKIKKVLKNFIFISYNYKIGNKFIDMLGKCEETGKNIIVEFKVKNRCGANQLYAYGRMLGGDNILVSVSEVAPTKKHEGIIYITGSKSKDYEIESGDIIRNQIEY